MYQLGLAYASQLGFGAPHEYEETGRVRAAQEVRWPQDAEGRGALLALQALPRTRGAELQERRRQGSKALRRAGAAGQRYKEVEEEVGVVELGNDKNSRRSAVGASRRPGQERPQWNDVGTSSSNKSGGLFDQGLAPDLLRKELLMKKREEARLHREMQLRGDEEVEQAWNDDFRRIKPGEFGPAPKLPRRRRPRSRKPKVDPAKQRRLDRMVARARARQVAKQEQRGKGSPRKERQGKEQQKRQSTREKHLHAKTTSQRDTKKSTHMPARSPLLWDDDERGDGRFDFCQAEGREIEQGWSGAGGIPDVVSLTAIGGREFLQEQVQQVEHLASPRGGDADSSGDVDVVTAAKTDLDQELHRQKQADDETFVAEQISRALHDHDTKFMSRIDKLISRRFDELKQESKGRRRVPGKRASPRKSPARNTRASNNSDHQAAAGQPGLEPSLRSQLAELSRRENSIRAKWRHRVSKLNNLPREAPTGDDASAINNEVGSTESSANGVLIGRSQAWTSSKRAKARRPELTPDKLNSILENQARFRGHRNLVEASLRGSNMTQAQIIESLADVLHEQFLTEVCEEVLETCDDIAETIFVTI